MNADLYTLASAEKWRATLEGFPAACRDIYYGPEYYRTWSQHESAEAMCLHLFTDGIHFLYPFFRKQIDPSPNGKEIFDISSAYGYGGIIADVPADAVSKTTIDKVNDHIDGWCTQNGVVAEFVRQNPLFAGSNGPLRRAENTTVRQNVYRRYDVARQIQSASARRNVRKAKRNGLQVVVDDSMQTAKEFQRLYDETARRVQMGAYYFFGEDYMAAVIRWLKPYAMLVNVVMQNEVIAAAMVLQQGPFTTYHLSGSAGDRQKLYPNDLLLAALVDLADQGGASVLSFGGGLGGAKDDALFAFKKRFGNFTCPVSIGKNVHDAKQYGQLCATWEQKNPHLRKRYSHYFLKYRMTQ